MDSITICVLHVAICTLHNMLCKMVLSPKTALFTLQYAYCNKKVQHAYCTKLFNSKSAKQVNASHCTHGVPLLLFLVYHSPLAVTSRMLLHLQLLSDLVVSPPWRLPPLFHLVCCHSSSAAAIVASRLAQPFSQQLYPCRHLCLWSPPPSAAHPHCCLLSTNVISSLLHYCFGLLFFTIHRTALLTQSTTCLTRSHSWLVFSCVIQYAPTPVQILWLRRFNLVPMYTIWLAGANLRFRPFILSALTIVLQENDQSLIFPRTRAPITHAHVTSKSGGTSHGSKRHLQKNFKMRRFFTSSTWGGGG